MKTQRYTLVPTGFLIGLVATIVVQRLFRQYPLTTSDAPYGIVSFEFASSAKRARRIVDSWRASGLIENVRPNIRVDDLGFIPCYVVTLFLGCTWASGAFDRHTSRVVRWVSVGQVVAGALDLAENRAMLHTLAALESHNNPGISPALATVCATLKFVLVIVGIMTTRAGAAARLRQNR
jgi:hypothetical protein